MILIWLGLLITILLFSIQREGFVNNSMNLFANNNINSTCKSTYSSDSGMVCIDKSQEHLLLTRGGNRTFNDGDYHTDPLT
jgi:hypothetical protein